MSTAKAVTALTFCPLHEYELERFLAFVAAGSHFKNVAILALPGRMAMAKAVAARHPELPCAVHEYPLTSGCPEYYDPDRASELPVDLMKRPGETAGVVLVFGAAVPFPVMKTVCASPMKPQYNCFRILKTLGVSQVHVFSLNSLEEVRMPFLLDDFAGIHKGRRCFVVGNGPSLKNLDMTLLKDEITLGSNKVYLGFKEWGFDFTYWGIVDDRQVELYPDEWEAKVPKDMVKFFPFEYLKVLNFENGCPLNTYHTGNFPYPHNFIDPKRPKEHFTALSMFSTSPDVIYLGWTVTYMLLQIAAVMGCNPIYLIGADHRFKITEEDRKRGYWTNEKGENHFHEGYSANKIFNLPDDKKAEAHFNHAAQYCRSNGISIYNATPGTALKSFPLVDFNALFPSFSTSKCGNVCIPAQCQGKEAGSGDDAGKGKGLDAAQCLPQAPVAAGQPEKKGSAKKVTILLCTPDMQSEIARRCLDSLFKNTGTDLYKLTIADNKWDTSFSHSHEMNKCLTTLDTPYFVCLDDDVVLTPGWLEALLAAANADPSAGAVGCVHTFADGTINHSGGTLYSAGGSLRTKQAVSPISSLEYTTYVCSACVLFRKTPLLFDETYMKYRFEVDYCFKLWESGLRVAVVPHKIYHLVSQQMLQKVGQNMDKVKEAHKLDEVIFSRTWYDSNRLNTLYRAIAGKLTHPDIRNAALQQDAGPIPSPKPSRLTAADMLPFLILSRLQLLKATHVGRLVIFGAGKHTAWLDRILGRDREMPPVCAILDDNPGDKGPFFGLKPSRAAEFSVEETDAIILSTDCKQKEMAAACRKRYGQGVKLVDLYEGLPPGPYDKS